MRIGWPAGLIGLVLLAACGGEDDAAPLPAASESVSGPMENAAESGARDVGFVLTCGAHFPREATPATLAAAFGRENVVPQTISGPEGDALDITAIYPDDPERRVEITFANVEERTDLTSVTIRGPTSRWSGPAGVVFGGSIADVEAANGAPFALTGFGWDYGGYVSDWKGGALSGAGDCQYTLRFAPQASAVPPALLGDGVSLMSDDPEVRATSPVVTLIGLTRKR